MVTEKSSVCFLCLGFLLRQRNSLPVSRESHVVLAQEVIVLRVLNKYFPFYPEVRIIQLESLLRPSERAFPQEDTQGIF